MLLQYFAMEIKGIICREFNSIEEIIFVIHSPYLKAMLFHLDVYLLTNPLILCCVSIIKIAFNSTTIIIAIVGFQNINFQGKSKIARYHLYLCCTDTVPVRHEI